jgi:hypothetical protein
MPINEMGIGDCVGLFADIGLKLAPVASVLTTAEYTTETSTPPADQSSPSK